ncbi:hypothetical protein [Kocuria atrinae]|uniref:hypothetical protein n=1 Tax=Kocuria atrinae TaxID=592377 RepID=UPI0002E666D6|nr:hypothetical protein [Kocuria atrinae]
MVLLVGPQDEPRYRETLTPRAVERLTARGRDIREEYLPTWTIPSCPAPPATW